MFTVKIEKTDHDLFDVSPKDSDVDAVIQIVKLEPLDPLLPLSQVFHRVKENKVHVIVRVPTNGELIRAGIDSLIDVV